MVRQWQEMFYDRRYSAVEHPCPDWAEVAEAFGATGMRVSERSELRDALKEMLECEGPVVMHVHVDPDENVYPMVAVGKGLHEMDLGKLA